MMLAVKSGIVVKGSYPGGEKNSYFKTVVRVSDNSVLSQPLMFQVVTTGELVEGVLLGDTILRVHALNELRNTAKIVA